MTVSQDQLKQLVHYDPETGIFTWLVNRQPGIRIGDVAGTLRDDGYIRIQVAGERKYASHWAWLYMTGEYPPYEVDHEDRNRSNNSWRNLRSATKSLNCANRPKRVRESGLLRGTTRNGGKFTAQIRVRGEHRYLGTYDTEEEAHAAYAKAALPEFREFSVLAAMNDNKPVRAVS